jgi:Ran GTPase-activating protein (RanGAP) involved in mRNA processing and transport
MLFFAGIVMILNALKSNNTITELHITQNTLGDEGINALCDMLKTVHTPYHFSKTAFV